MRYDAVLYDFDGTLVDTIPMILETYQRAFMDVTGHQEDETFLLSRIGLPLASTFVKYDPMTQQALLDAYCKHNMILLPTHVSVFEGILQGLEEVRDLGVLQGLVTSKRSETALFTMRQFGLEPFFDALVFREDTQVHKPNPMPVYLAMERLGIKDASRVLFVGDSVHDLRCAANAGVDSVAVRWTYMPEDELMAENPTYWIERLSDLSCILTEAEL